MLSFGAKKKENPSRMDSNTEDLPQHAFQLTNEMQLSIMNKVKSGEISIEDALVLAGKDQKQTLKQKNQAEEEQQPTQYNFSVHKHNRYRWQKRVLQLDFKTKMLCSIQKGIIKRQLPFALVKSCDDGVGSRFSISFKEHHDYELEATSLEDKHKIMELVNQIIYGNIYSDPVEGQAETYTQPQSPQSLREGVLLLHRGGLASFRWVKYEVRLHPGQLTLVPFKRQALAEDEVAPTAPTSTVIHLSDGDTRVEKPHSPDTFTLITHKNTYWFKMPALNQKAARGDVERERDAWVQAIDNLCLEWKRRSLGEHVFVETLTLRHISIEEEEEDAENSNSNLESNGGHGGHNPPVNHTSADPQISGGGTRVSVVAESDQSAKKPVPTPRRKTSVEGIRADFFPAAPPPASPSAVTLSPPTSPRLLPTSPRLLPTSPQPTQTAITFSKSIPEPVNHESGLSAVKHPPPPIAPLPPPLPIKKKTSSRKPHTKAFHWDVVSSEKIGKSFWTQGSSRGVEIDTSRLFEQFAVKHQGTFGGASEPSTTQHIILDPKIAHNLNIFLKSFPVQPEELKDKLFIINEEDGGLSDEHIASLRRYVPTVDDVEKYKSHKGPVSELHIVDQYMMEMCNIPGLSAQLDLLLTLRELPISMNDLQPLINQKIRMCIQLNNCRSFVSVLEYLLTIGNYLNENAGKGKAKGFRLSSLQKLPQFRGRDRSFTLLHALVEQIVWHEPCLATFTQELAEFETVPGASIKGLTAEIDVLKNELQKVLQYRKTSKRKTAIQPSTFSKDLKTVIDKYNMELSGLTRTCEEMKKLYSAILVKFGEPADQDSQELFGLICQFVHDFKKAHDEIR